MTKYQTRLSRVPQPALTLASQQPPEKEVLWSTSGPNPPLPHLPCTQPAATNLCAKENQRPCLENLHRAQNSERDPVQLKCSKEQRGNFASTAEDLLPLSYPPAEFGDSLTTRHAAPSSAPSHRVTPLPSAARQVSSADPLPPRVLRRGQASSHIPITRATQANKETRTRVQHPAPLAVTSSATKPIVSLSGPASTHSQPARPESHNSRSPSNFSFQYGSTPSTHRGGNSQPTSTSTSVLPTDRLTKINHSTTILTSPASPAGRHSRHSTRKVQSNSGFHVGVNKRRAKNSPMVGKKGIQEALVGAGFGPFNE